MAECTTSTIDVGKNVLAEWVEGCGDLAFESATYKLFGTINTKSLNFTSSTSDTTNDQSGADTSTIVTRRDGEFSVGGFQTTLDSAISNQTELIQYYHNELDAGRQPSLWIKLSGPNYPRIYYVYCIITAVNEGFNTDDPNSFEMTFKPTDTGVPGTSAVQLRVPLT